MYHDLEFLSPMLVALKVPRQDRLENLWIRKRDRLRARLKPYVVEGAWGPVEVADLFFEDGTSTRGVRFECFKFG
jgi:hypothetical protein